MRLDYQVTKKSVRRENRHEKASEYEQEMPQSQTNPRHNEEETQNTTAT